MQDRYVGDFGKYGLLRRLCSEDKHGRALRLGVLWYKFDGEDNAVTNDGSRIQYLFKPSGQQRLLSSCDPDLFNEMQAIVSKRRSIAAVETAGILPEGTVFYHKGLSFDEVPLGKRLEKRRDWIDAGLRQVRDAHMVFFDPDNGMEVRSCSKRSKYAPKYAFYEDLFRCWERGQSLVIYQHFGRNSNAEKQVRSRCEALLPKLSCVEPLVLRFRRGPGRGFFVLAQPKHSDMLASRVESFLESPWGMGSPPHFEKVEC